MSGMIGLFVVACRDGVLRPLRQVPQGASIDLPCPTTRSPFHDRTEVKDAGRARPREGWSSWRGSVRASRDTVGALRTRRASDSEARP